MLSTLIVCHSHLFARTFDDVKTLLESFGLRILILGYDKYLDGYFAVLQVFEMLGFRFQRSAKELVTMTMTGSSHLFSQWSQRRTPPL